MRRILALAIVASTVGTSAYALDLEQAYQQALKNDPQWAAINNQYWSDSLKVELSHGALKPTVGLSAAVNTNKVDPESGASYNYTGTQLALQLRQPLYRADLWKAYSKAQALNSVNEANLRQKLQEQVQRVSEAYFNVLRAEETLGASKSEEAALKRQLEQAQKRFDVGLIAKTDVLEAQAQLDGATASRISQEVGLAVRVKY